MSYVQVEIGGKLRGWKANQYTVITMAQYADLDNYEATAGYAMIYAGLKANCFVKREEFVDKVEMEVDGKKQMVDVPITFEQVCDWVEEMTPEVLLQVYAVFSETQAYKNLIEKGKEKTEAPTKKKLSRKELKT